MYTHVYKYMYADVCIIYIHMCFGLQLLPLNMCVCISNALHVELLAMILVAGSHITVLHKEAFLKKAFCFCLCS